MDAAVRVFVRAFDSTMYASIGFLLRHPQRATSECASLSHDEWVAAAEEQYRMEADR